jgi:diaminopimelate epimerase
MNLPFAKMCATGNDFIVIDDRAGRFDRDDEAGIRRLCTRRLSIGADGLLLLVPDPELDFAMVYFNSDGREASMCGNGARCIAFFAHRAGAAGREMTFRSRSGVHEAVLHGIDGDRADVAVTMGDPVDHRPDRRIELDGRSLRVGSVDTGVPHAVLRVEDLDAVDVRGEGRAVRHHAAFGEAGANVDFVEFRGGDTIRVRTYERGVEDETLSCGTGAVASALMAASWEGFAAPVRVETASGEVLVVGFERVGTGFRRVTLRGEARVVYRAEPGEV